MAANSDMLATTAHFERISPTSTIVASTNCLPRDAAVLHTRVVVGSLVVLSVI